LLDWAAIKHTATIYALTTIRLPKTDELPPLVVLQRASLA
jgi:hypothetical protein